MARTQSLPDDIMNPGDLTWFRHVRLDLLREWRRKAYYRGTRWKKREAMACRIIPDDRGESEPHLSLPCSLAAEADHVEALLRISRLDRDPVLFLRLYLIVLDELCDRLDKLAGCLCLAPQWPAESEVVAAWANHIGKHRGALLRYHHPFYLFLDSPSGRACEARVRKLALTDSQVVVVDGRTVDERKLAEHARKANSAGLAVLIVPPLAEFLDAAIGRYSAFVGAVTAGDASMLDAFESRNFDNDIAEQLRRVCESAV